MLAARALRRTSTDEERAELEQATAEILRLKRELSRSFFDLGRRLLQVERRKLYRAHGHATFEAYLAREVGFSRSHAYTFMRVAGHLPEELALELGVERSEALLALLESTPKQERMDEVAALQVSSWEDERRLKVPLRKATVAQLRAAARRAGAQARSRRRTKLPADARAFLRRAEPALRRLQISVSTDGRRVQFGAIPLARLAEFSTMLRRLLAPK
jgi:hypothetical protein